MASTCAGRWMLRRCRRCMTPGPSISSWCSPTSRSATAAVAFTRHFGEPEIFHQTSLSALEQRARDLPGLERRRGRPADAPGEPTQKQLSSARQWHTEFELSADAQRGLAAARHRDQPHRRHHSVHQHVQGLRGSADDAGRQVDGRRARHDFGMLHRITGAPAPTEAERTAMPPVWHPMVRRHPVSGRTSLYISPIYNDAGRRHRREARSG